jgi:ABC-type dipeptide/oligopeptide/nickel transport system ATPase component
MGLVIHKAVKHKSKLRLGLVGTSGSGKTWSSLVLAQELGKKVLLIDTENSGNLYADIFDYEICSLSDTESTAPFSVERYLEAISLGIESLCDVIIIDSLSHAWSGEGGILDRKERLDAVGGNGFANWRKVTPLHNQLVDAIVQSPTHMIVTMRAKTEYVLETDEKGRTVPRKVGLAPIQREGMDYEFTTVFDLSVTGNLATASKDRTSLFRVDMPEQITSETGKKLKKWLESSTSLDRALKEGLEKIKIAHDEEQLGIIYKAHAELWKNEQFIKSLKQRKEELNKLLSK